MYIYEIKTKRLIYDTPLKVEVMATGCYSGFGEGKDNASLQPLKGIGPLPTGAYLIGDQYTHPELGPVTMNLTPWGFIKLYDRSLFRIHGDSIKNPGMGSHGCIVVPRPQRERISEGTDRILLVTTGGI